MQVLVSSHLADELDDDGMLSVFEGVVFGNAEGVINQEQ